MSGDPGYGPPPLGTSHQRYYSVRAVYLDGRIEDSPPTITRPRNAEDPFGRRHFPPGTWFERRARVVTLTSSGWMDEAAADRELVRRAGEDVPGQVLGTEFAASADTPGDLPPVTLRDLLQGFLEETAPAFVDAHPEVLAALINEERVSPGGNVNAQVVALVRRAIGRMIDVC